MLFKKVCALDCKFNCDSDLVFHLSGGVPDYLRVAKYFLVKFREGELGRLSMDIAAK